jgi:hypothetical protein
MMVMMPVAEIDTEPDVATGGTRRGHPQREQYGQCRHDRCLAASHDKALHRRMVKARSTSYKNGPSPGMVDNR